MFEGKFNYTMNNSGFLVGEIVSEVEISQGDALSYNGTRLSVVSKNDTVLEVRKTGYLINVRDSLPIPPTSSPEQRKLFQ